MSEYDSFDYDCTYDFPVKDDSLQEYESVIPGDFVVINGVKFTTKEAQDYRSGKYTFGKDKALCEKLSNAGIIKIGMGEIIRNDGRGHPHSDMELTVIDGQPESFILSVLAKENQQANDPRSITPSVIHDAKGWFAEVQF
jgi:hypothetical protein